MPSIAKIIGGAGTGKTTELLNLMAKAIQAGGYDVRDIGFCSFTRAARAEAAFRAADLFDCNPKELETDGWFKTAHSICYHQLAVGSELLGPSVATRNWIQETIQEEVSGCNDGPQEDMADRNQEATDADKLLCLHSLARNRIVPFDVIYRELVDGAGWGLRWSLEQAKDVIQRYERGKRLDHRCDFTDLLSRFAGISHTVTGPLRITPQGICPSIPVLFIDEAQDNTPLMDAVFRRLAEQARWVYLSGDPFQAIYGWNGSDPTLFQAWGADKSRVLDQSYRCPERILSRGEECLKSCSDYWDRGIRPVSPGGEVIEHASKYDWLSEIDPGQSWLLLARTNYQAGRIKGWLKGEGIPWEPIKGNGGWKKSKKQGVLANLCGLELGDPVSFDGWGDILAELPAEYFERGTKAGWKNREPSGEFDHRFTGGLRDWGATERLQQVIASGAWCQLVDNGYEYRAAQRRYGWSAVTEPKIRIGTIHAAKGMEADNVVVLTTTSRPVWAAADSDRRQADEEKRLSYVAVTRARRRVFLMTEPDSRYRMEALCS